MGTPNSLSSEAISILIPLRLAMSIIVRAITTGTFRSIICVQKEDFFKIAGIGYCHNYIRINVFILPNQHFIANPLIQSFGVKAVAARKIYNSCLACSDSGSAGFYQQ